MINPVSTYRLQFHKDFNFDDFEKIIPYLQKLGVKTVYASPVFESVPGSVHGYDGLNPHQINPEIGTEEQLYNISKKLKENGMLWLQDIVPNHMAFDPQNLWLNDVLEKGQRSVFAPFFDTDFTGIFFHGKLMVPFLGDSLEETIKKSNLKIDFQEDSFTLNYYETHYPLNPRSYASMLFLSDKKPEDAINQLIDQLEDLEMLDNNKAYDLRWKEIKLQLSSLMKNPEIRSIVQGNITKINEKHELLKNICEEQHYRLCSYSETDSKINYRRFFTVNSLICLNIQNPEVFDFYHQKIKDWLNEDVFQGLRIDHVDGLFDPTLYLEQLRELAGDETYIAVEKILEKGEKLPQNWPIEGTTGYDFLALVNNLFTNQKAETAFTKLYEDLIGKQEPEEKQLREKKAFILREHMGGELENLYHFFLELNLADPKKIKKIKPEELKNAIAAVLIFCPVYRFYGNEFPLADEEFSQVKEVFANIRKEQPELELALDLLEDALLHPSAKNKNNVNSNALLFYQRLMQFTGPLMAKGVEDTLMYTYNRFIAHNDVGDDPAMFGVSAKEFHQQMQEKQEKWPLSINTTSTHDTKRGEDARARLNVLTDLADEWAEKVKFWQELNSSLKSDNQPDTNDEYFIYQTLIATFPMPGTEDNYPERLQQYMQKALREAKTNTSWAKENEKYEQATAAFIDGLLDEKRNFWFDFKDFHQKIADFGIINSLSQLLLKFTCPGVPDVYQGGENWDLSLVDPDNRRPVDYEKRSVQLEKITAKEALKSEDLWETRYDGTIKLDLLHKLLDERNSSSDLFLKGEYLPLKIKGKYKKELIAFARHHEKNWYVVIAPLHLAKICKDQNTEITKINWKNTRIKLPAEVPQQWTNLLDNSTDSVAEDAIEISGLFANFPLALLKMEQKESARKAGILMHVTSLPSPFGVGDLGPEAYNFAENLYKSKQQLWQLLPLNPTGAEQGNSPYSSLSSMAGNTLLISPEKLFEEGLLGEIILEDFYLPTKDQADFEAAKKAKDILFEEAYKNFRFGKFDMLQKAFADFCEKESFWLDDFALFMVLKQHHQNKFWYEWPEKLKKRDPKTLEKFAKNHQDELQKEKFLQFLFSRQWLALKDFCHKRSIKLMGDLPFYVSYDSVDVWANPQLFSLDKNSKMVGVAGVPPDYFNEDGQLWGMPVFCWDVLKADNYKWWMQRIRKNIELFDLLRMDHFRAFSAYWEVPSGEKTAKNGEWKNGPGSDFFKTLQDEFDKLPFVAEDLGEITDDVYELRDEFALPGMKVLQFAFGDDLPKSIHIPHNYPQNAFAYTGTHDNTTIVGWYKNDANKATKKRLEEYLDEKLSGKNVAWKMVRLAYSSVAKTVIIPMQDILGLDENSRMNTPSSAEKNWLWRMQPGEFKKPIQKQLRKLTLFYNRI